MRHPLLISRERLVFWWLTWLLVILGQLLLYFFAYGRLSVVFIVDGVLSLLIFSGIGLSLWYPFSFFNSGKSGPVAIITNLTLTGALSILIWMLIVRYSLQLALPGFTDLENYWESTFLYRIVTGVFIYFLTVLSYYLFLSLTRLSEKKAREARLESLVRETELKMLRSQINPHFLFNSLNSISSLTITNPDKARDMVIKLSEFMRYALSKKDEQPVTLRSELENLRLYLEIEKVRFGDRLSTTENIDENCLDIKVPVMILQPLYENAVKHGVYETTECVAINTLVACRNEYLEITISNNYDLAALPVKGTGTGLANVARRLDLFYGNNASLRTSKENGLFSVSVFLPAEA
ncbi:MAG: sensor histidine kinase [Bacteroidales bacterium]|jgi:two-component system LytT family sensor kinase